jgi:cobalamin biosynthesis protein CbiD
MNALCNGFTTGGCAAAATKASVLSLVEGRQPERIEEVGP